MWLALLFLLNSADLDTWTLVNFNLLLVLWSQTSFLASLSSSYSSEGMEIRNIDSKFYRSKTEKFIKFYSSRKTPKFIKFYLFFRLSFLKPRAHFHLGLLSRNDKKKRTVGKEALFFNQVILKPTAPSDDFTYNFQRDLHNVFKPRQARQSPGSHLW